MHSTSFSSLSTLVRLLDPWTPVGAEAPGPDVAERMSLWFGPLDAIRLQAMHQAMHQAVVAAADERKTSKPATRQAPAVADDLQRVRGVLAKAISQDPLALAGLKPDDPEDPGYGPFHQRHIELQRQMGQMVGALRDHVRQAVARVSPRLRQLAVLDASLEELMAAREQALLPTTALLLERRFTQLRAAHRQVHEITEEAGALDSRLRGNDGERAGSPLSRRLAPGPAGRAGPAPGARGGLDRRTEQRIEVPTMSKRFFAVAFAIGLAAVAWVGLGFVGIELARPGHDRGDRRGLPASARWELRQFRAATAALRGRAGGHCRSRPQAWAIGSSACRLRCATRCACASRASAPRLPGPALTPYLVGLLVMLGMLGTFLGMVVTFKGAVFALEGSTDLQAIRSALAEPIKGLGLSFGTSVAGRGGVGHAGPDVGHQPARAAGGRAPARQRASPPCCGRSRSPTSARRPSARCRRRPTRCPRSSTSWRP